MQPNAFAARGYAQNTRNTGAPRSVEYQAFQKITAKLREVASPETPFARLAEAVHGNNRLWATLAADLLSKGNQLPDDLRAGLIGLSEFSRKGGMQILTGPETATVTVADLIEVNTAVMRGLRGVEPANASATAPLAPKVTQASERAGAGAP